MREHEYQRHRFPRRYTRDDILRLVEVDQAHDLRTRRSDDGQDHAGEGERKRPEPDGQPGYLRIDTVHQPERDGVKSLYHIDAVDEVTQWEVLGWKNIGYQWLEPSHAPAVDEFYRHWFNPYLNYHRPCSFATVTTDVKGKQKKVYDVYLTPYERLRQISPLERFLKPGLTLAGLEEFASADSDTGFARKMQAAKRELFQLCGLLGIESGAALPPHQGAAANNDSVVSGRGGHR